MLPKTHRLTTARDFERLSTKGRSVFGPYATMRLREIPQKATKIGFITSTKAFKLAVDRNRVKRQMRHVIKELLAEIPNNIHLLFVLKPEAMKATHAQQVEEVRRLLGKIPEALKMPAKMSPRAVKMQAKRAEKPKKA